VSESRLADPDARVAMDSYYSLIEAVTTALGDPFWQVSYIEQIEPASLDAVGFLAMSSRTVGEGVRRIIQHHPLMNTGEVFALETVGDRAVFRFEPWGPPRPAHAHIAEMYAADCLLLPARFTGRRLEVLSFRLRHAALGPTRTYAQRFGRVPEFEAGANEWSVALEVLDWPLPRADPGLAEFFDRHLEERRRRSPGRSWRERVRQAVCEVLPDGAVTVAAVAARLQSSSRTLQRRLANEGASFELLLDEVRAGRALVYLEMDLPVAEVSYLLGFAEPAAFHHAFKRWTGTTPRQWRAGQAAPTPRRSRRRTL
jgi:AraC-like DNA-binding protein